jgi:hypothetical protein
MNRMITGALVCAAALGVAASSASATQLSATSFARGQCLGTIELRADPTGHGYDRLNTHVWGACADRTYYVHMYGWFTLNGGQGHQFQYSPTSNDTNATPAFNSNVLYTDALQGYTYTACATVHSIFGWAGIEQPVCTTYNYK